ncbi:hypothetical protein AAEX28_06775 [Lentisphaerota bacterium WC36G]|nr:hypothetical protein LJT99_09640 [Lentisphaerae bacterium WC36]
MNKRKDLIYKNIESFLNNDIDIDEFESINENILNKSKKNDQEFLIIEQINEVLDDGHNYSLSITKNSFYYLQRCLIFLKEDLVLKKERVFVFSWHNIFSFVTLLIYIFLYFNFKLFLPILVAIVIVYREFYKGKGDFLRYNGFLPFKNKHSFKKHISRNFIDFDKNKFREKRFIKIILIDYLLLLGLTPLYLFYQSIPWRVDYIVEK